MKDYEKLLAIAEKYSDVSDILQDLCLEAESILGKLSKPIDSAMADAENGSYRAARKLRIKANALKNEAKC